MMRAVLIGLLVCAATPALAVCRDTPAHRQACGRDVLALCLREAYSARAAAVVSCLQHNRARLSASCHAALAACAARPRRHRVVDGA